MITSLKRQRKCLRRRWQNKKILWNCSFGDSRGLGFSIVQSFAEACGGEGAIQTDADIFTLCVKFPLTQNGVTIAGSKN